MRFHNMIIATMTTRDLISSLFQTSAIKLRVFQASSRIAILLAVAMWRAFIPAYSQMRVYTPAAPEGTNSAAYATTRDDWFLTVQGKFDRYSGKQADILFDGDSITNRWETTGKTVWDAHFAGRAANFGIEGDRTENLLWRLSKGQVSGVDPKVVVLMIGTNNVSRNSYQDISSAVEAIVLQYETLCPSAHILLMAVFPRGKTPADPNRMKLVQANKELAERFGKASDPRVTFVDISKQLTQIDGNISVDMMPDLVHPTVGGYAIWADAIFPYIAKYAPGATR
jgi:lysophospholipase L1-like esterase